MELVLTLGILRWGVGVLKEGFREKVEQVARLEQEAAYVSCISL